jgi:hypothetical protein
MDRIKIKSSDGNTELKVSHKAFDLVYSNRGFTLARGQSLTDVAATTKTETGTKASVRKSSKSARKTGKKSTKKSVKAAAVNRAGAGTESDKTEALTAET